MRDDLFNPFNDESETIDYVTAEKVQDFSDVRPITGGKDQQNLAVVPELRIDITLSTDMIVSERKRYNFWDAVGDIGGFHDGIVLIIQVLMAPYSAMMFNIGLTNGTLYQDKPSKKEREAHNRLS